MDDERVDIECTFFECFTEEEMAELRKFMEKRTYKAGSVVYGHGEPAVSMFLVVKGMVSLKEMKAGPEAESIIFQICRPGDLFGTAPCLKPQYYLLTASCLEDSDIIVIDNDKLNRYCTLHDVGCFYVMNKLTAKFLQLSN